MRVHTESIQFKADQKLLDLIERKLEKVTTFFDHIINADVTLKLENSGKIKDKIIEVRLKVPGEILIASEKNKTFEACIDKVVASLKRQLIRYKEKMRA